MSNARFKTFPQPSKGVGSREIKGIPPIAEISILLFMHFQQIRHKVIKQMPLAAKRDYMFTSVRGHPASESLPQYFFWSEKEL